MKDTGFYCVVPGGHFRGTDYQDAVYGPSYGPYTQEEIETYGRSVYGSRGGDPEDGAQAAYGCYYESRYA